MQKKAEMGVGTLIIFIALLLVAAVAAGVLINTAGTLQEKALTTGKQATAMIATHAEVVEVSAVDASSTSNNDIENFSVIMKLSPGSDKIKFSDVTITFSTLSETQTMIIDSSTTGDFVDPANDNGTFGVEYLQKGSNWASGNLQKGDVVRINFDSQSSIGSDQPIRFSFIPKIGSPTLTSFNTPDVMSATREYLYP